MFGITQTSIISKIVRTLEGIKKSLDNQNKPEIVFG